MNESSSSVESGNEAGVWTFAFKVWKKLFKGSGLAPVTQGSFSCRVTRRKKFGNL